MEHGEEKPSEKQNISEIVAELCDNGFDPILNGKKLKEIEEKNLLDFIREKSVLSNQKDIALVLGSKLEKGDQNFEKIYDIIFTAEKNLVENATVIAGGTGSGNLVKGLLDIGTDITILVNAYDDGKSTGDIREKFSMLGPSDICKNMISLINGKDPNLEKFLNYRFPAEKNNSELKEDLRNIVLEPRKSSLFEIISKVDFQKIEIIRKFLSTFYEALEKWENINSEEYFLQDYGMRNVVYVGAFFYYGRNYSLTNENLKQILDLKGKVVLNSYENVWLNGLTKKGNFLGRESEIVFGYPDEEIEEIYLVEKLLNKQEKKILVEKKLLSKKIEFMKNKSKNINSSCEALDSIKKSDIIIFAPTTFFSSLAPTLMTCGLKEEIKNSDSLKISLLNLVRERGMHTASEKFDMFEKYLASVEEIDYLIVNNHRERTDGVSDANRIPIDLDELFTHNVEVIEIKAEDSENQDKHSKETIREIVYSLKKLKNIGYCLYCGRLTKVGKISRKDNLKKKLKRLLKNPILFEDKKNRIKNILNEILDLKELKDFVPIRKTRVLILGAGKGTRLESNIPKIIYPINGKANLAYLIDTYYEIDPHPVVAISKESEIEVRKWLEVNPKYNPELLVMESTGSTATDFLKACEEKFSKEDELDIFLSWGDITNVSKETVKITLATHQAIGNNSITLPTSWERKPYAGISRDENGNVSDIFLTKENYGKIPKSGEHDVSIFALKKKDVVQIIKEMKMKENKEINFLKIIPQLIEEGKSVSAIACSRKEETRGFNTKKEAEEVEKNMNILGRRENTAIPFEDLFKKVKITKEKTIENSERIKKYLKKSYNGIVLDFDGTLSDESTTEMPDEILQELIKLIREKIPIGIVSGRTWDSLKSRLIDRIKENSNLEESDILASIDIYPEGGSYCFSPKRNKNYSKRIPTFISETAIKLLRKEILDYQDNYAIKSYKIHIWPKNPLKQKGYVSKINSLFSHYSLPLIALRSNAEDYNGSIIIINEEGGKKAALKHFLEKNEMKADQIVKIGDMADIHSVDHSLLFEEGSFSVFEFDPESSWQASVNLYKGKDYTSYRGTLWLLSNLNINKREN